jgi:trans-aconitate methyltransferase
VLGPGLGGEQRHFCAHRDAFKELFEAGYAVIRENSQWGEHFQIKKGDYVENNEWRHPPLITKDGIEVALRDAGYSGTATLQTDEREFPSVDLLKDWVKTMIRPFMNRIPENHKDAFVGAWIKRYLEDTKQQSTGPVKLWDRNLLVVAEKVL